MFNNSTNAGDCVFSFHIKHDALTTLTTRSYICQLQNVYAVITLTLFGAYEHVAYVFVHTCMLFSKILRTWIWSGCPLCIIQICSYG